MNDLVYDVFYIYSRTYRNQTQSAAPVGIESILLLYADNAYLSQSYRIYISIYN